MVRLVFRPYTQVRRAICTSAPLRASTRVSSGFTLLRHSSPSFGSQHECSLSNLSQKIKVGRWCKFPIRSYFHYACGFGAHTLASMLDSLVRVSRRVGERYFARVAQRRAVFSTPRHTRAQLRGPVHCPGTAKRPHTPLALFASPLTVSGPLSLSFQSAFHLSFTVLVRYRSPANI